MANEVAQAQAVVDRLEAQVVQNDDTRLEDHLFEQMVSLVEALGRTEEAAEVRRQLSAERVQFAETQFGRATDAASTRAVSDTELDAAELSFHEAQKAYTQDNLILSAIQAINAASARLPNMVRDYIDKKSLARAVLEKQRSEALAALADALTRQQRGEMKSPVDGVVLERQVSPHNSWRREHIC